MSGNGNQKMLKFGRNRKRSKIMGISSANEFLEKHESNKDEYDDNISYEEIKEKKNIKQKRIIFMDQKDEINSTTSKRSNENKLLLRNNLNFHNTLDRTKYDKITNKDFNIDFPGNKIETYTFYKNNINFLINIKISSDK
jgi:hypothetical protein